MKSRIDIFSDNQLHPKAYNSIRSHYSGYFDEIYICWTPFFTLKEQDYIDFQASDYPEDEEVFERGAPVNWEKIRLACGFQSTADVLKALKTLILAYRKRFERLDLAKKLKDHTEANNIYIPNEGCFNALSIKQIYKSFKLLNKSELIAVDEFYQNQKTLAIDSMSELDFFKSINFNDKYIYDADRELLFAVDWDSFFFLMCSNQENIENLVKELDIEGLYCEENTKINWELDNQGQ